MSETVGSVALVMSQPLKSAVTTETNRKLPGSDVESNAFAALLMGMLAEIGLPALPDLPDVALEVQLAGLPSGAVLPPDGTLLINEPSVADIGKGLEEQTDEGQGIPIDLTPPDPAAIAKSVLGDPPLTIQVTEARSELQQKPDDDNGNQPVQLSQDSSISSDAVSRKNLEPAIKKEQWLDEKEQDVNRILSAEVVLGGDSSESLLGELESYQEPKATKVQSVTNTFSSLTSEPQAVTTRLGSAENVVPHERAGLSVDKAASFFRQALQQAGRQKRSGRQEITLKLDPPHLGRVYLTLLHRAGAISARFAVENDIAQGTLQANMVELKNSLGELGIQVEDFSVFIGLGQGGAGTNQFEGQHDGMTPDQEHTLSPAHMTSVTFDDQTKGRMLMQSSLDLLV
ncbi:MAG: flagellar hook-length control protein FliK [bacterium]